MPQVGKSGISEVTATALLLMITLSLGLLVWGFSAGWSFSASIEYSQETDEEIAQLESLIHVELSYMENGKCVLYVRNVGETGVEITAVDVRPEGESFFDRVTFSNLVIGKDAVQRVDVNSPYCDPSSGKAVKLMIHYTAERIADNPGRVLKLPHLVAPVTLSLSGYSVGEWCPINTVPRLLYLSSTKEDWDFTGREGFILFSGSLLFTARAGSGYAELRLGNGSIVTVNFNKQTNIRIKFDHDGRRYPTNGELTMLKNEKTIRMSGIHVKYIGFESGGSEVFYYDATVEFLSATVQDWGSTDFDFNFEYHGSWLDVDQPSGSNLPNGEYGSWHLYILYQKGEPKDIGLQMTFTSGGFNIDAEIRHGRGLLIGCV